MQYSMYHSFLKIGALTLALVVLFDSGLVSVGTKELANHTGHYLANTIGVTAGVRPTELNEYTAALTQKEQELQARETALEEREIAVNLQTDEGAPSQRPDYSTYILSTVLFILLILIVLNYALDFIRQNREEPYGRSSSLAS